ncbi:RAD55 family ATPase [Actinoplanes sp. NPDC049599]|uniref:RAD55 family ATPase n=1 Tax=Actinoplanes sp. NPDC049599 TaxID=3363903 RepID=UPI00379BE497
MTRVATGVPGLDVILGGGIERGSVAVLAGAPGSGKTILAQQMCFANATAERKAVYYTTLSEPHAKLLRHLASFDFFVSAALGPEVEYLHLGDLIRGDRSGRMASLVDEVARKTAEENPTIVVIDSAKALRDFAGDRELRMAFYDLTSRLTHTDTALLLGEYTPDEMASGVEFSLADTIVHLAYQPREPIDRRWLRVVKMRGTHHLEGKHTFRICSTGFEVFPRIETLDTGPAVAVAGRIPSGIRHLDELMGGGIGAGEATLVLGPSGAGKTIAGLRFVTEGVGRGDTCLYVTFQDTADQLVSMASGFGWDLAEARDRNDLVVLHVPLGELDLDLLASRIREELARGPIRRVVIDSLAEMVFAARETDRFPAYARSLIGLIRNAGATVLITSETTALGPSPEPIGGVMFLFHNVILLRYLERETATGRALNIVKMRNSDHSKAVHEFTIDDQGLRIGAGLRHVTGVLGWSALRAHADELGP